MKLKSALIVATAAIIVVIALIGGSIFLSNYIDQRIDQKLREFNKQSIDVTYFGQNTLPPELQTLLDNDVLRLETYKDPASNQTINLSYNVWKVDFNNINVVNMPNNIIDTLMKPLESEYPQLISQHTTIWEPTPRIHAGFVNYNADTSKFYLIIYSDDDLDSNTVIHLTNSLKNEVVPILIDWYT